MTTSASSVPAAPPRLLAQVRERVCCLHYSLTTEQAHVHGVRAFVRFHRLRHPKTMGRAEVEAFLSWLSGERGVSGSTHCQAWSARLSLYPQVFGQSLPWVQAIGRPACKPRLPVVLSAGAVRSPLDNLATVRPALPAIHAVPAPCHPVPPPSSPSTPNSTAAATSAS